jgi:phage terminase small subunit
MPNTDKQTKANDLTARQRLFVDEYMIDRNATQAAIRAGYSKKTANEQGARLLANVRVWAEVEKRTANASKRSGVSVGYVLSNLEEIIERCMQRAPVMEGTRQAKDGSGNHVWRFDSSGAVKALELIGKHLSMWEQKATVNLDEVKATLKDIAGTAWANM